LERSAELLEMRQPRGRHGGDRGAAPLRVELLPKGETLLKPQSSLARPTG
jgi:hypothetical protein